MIARVCWPVIALSVALAPVVAGAEPDHKLSLSVAAGAAYVRESWNPNDGNAGALKTGWAPALDLSVGRVLSPNLVAGGILEATALFDPTESFAGNSYRLTDQADVVCLTGVFVEDPRLPRVPVRAGLALGAVTSLLYDHAQDQVQARLGIGVSPFLGYDRRLSGRWQIGVLARVAFYRNVAGDIPSSATAGGLVTSLMVAFTRR